MSATADAVTPADAGNPNEAMAVPPETSRPSLWPW